MTSITKDPLLAIAKGLLWLMMGAMAIGGGGVLLAIPAVIVFQDRIGVEMAREAPALVTGDFIGALLVLLVCVAVLLGLMFRVFQLLKRIIDSVGEGDPFIPVNAKRLTHMAWLTLGTQLITAPLVGIGIWIKEAIEKGGEHDAHIVVNGGFEINGILLVLFLFILARVFREGTRLRDEVEGTV